MHPERRLWPVVALLIVFLGLTIHFARRIQQPAAQSEVDAISGYLALICGAVAVVALAVALVMLFMRRKE